MITINLNGPWQFRAIDPHGNLPADLLGLLHWMDATVPGTVHTDLLANGRIRDPFFGLQEGEVQWVDSVQWLYRRQFEVSEEMLRAGSVELVAHGIDTYAEVRCNGKVIGRSADMFVQHRFDVSRILRRGTNTLELLLDSPTVRAKSLERKHGRLEVALEPHRVYVRKAQYSFGWDWGPKLTTSGIWRSIAVEGQSHARLEQPFIRVVLADRKQAVVAVTADLKRLSRAPLKGRIVLSGGDWSAEWSGPVRGKRFHHRFSIPRPRLWWPNGYGEQPLYSATVSLNANGEEIQTLSSQFGIRTVRLLQQADAEGKSFIIEINGTRIFCKGADWIPCDSFLPRVPPSTYRQLLVKAQQAHMNMIRVWGGGIYEDETFYELCDSLGLMVWQDFMFACGEYPEEEWFLNQVRDEAAKVVRRLRNHPSVVLWCGNNECEWIYARDHPGESVDAMSGSRIFREILPSLCRSLDGTRPFWRSSPFGSGFPNDESNGNHHQWDVWSTWTDFRSYERDRARFVTEFGFQAPAHQRTLSAAMREEDRHPQSRAMEHHNKQVEGPERLYRFLAGHYVVREDFRDYIYSAQLVQADALKCAVEHWRRRKFATAGALFWQLNDCWPVSSWSVIDSALRPKAAYFFARRFFAPVLVSFRRDKGTVAVWVTSDLLSELAGTLKLSLRSFEGSAVWSRDFQIGLPPQMSKEIAGTSTSLNPAHDQSAHYLLARLWVGDTPIAENRFFFREPKHLQLPQPGLSVKLSEENRASFVLRLYAERFVKSVCAEFHGEEIELDDNYCDIDPGEFKDIHFRSALPKRRLKRKLRLRWVETPSGGA